MKKILQKDEPLLREKSKDVDPADIQGARIQKIIRNMKEAMHNEPDSAAIAAPQIGELVRIFVISKAILPKKEGVERDDLVFINPRIIKRSKKKHTIEEGCLSVRWVYGDVERFEKVTVEACNERGERVVYGASGLIAQAFQHEIDHLDGILFIDKAENIRDLPPKKDETKESKAL
jgi:peptide deformylase